MINKIINRYIEMQHSMGFKFRIQGCLLRSFGEFSRKNGDVYIRSKTIIDWAGLARSRAQKRNRLLTVRRFAIAMQAENNHHQVPPADIFGNETFKRRIPYILSSEELKWLLISASKLKSEKTIRPITYATLFALLAVAGIRISEALALNVEDFSDNFLVIRNTKFRKNRLVPLHESTQKGIQRYLKRRIQYGYGGGIDSALFISNNGKRLPYPTVISVFLQLVRSIGLRDDPGHPGVYIHDLRHRFAVKSLEQCYGDRASVSQHMLALSTYLGHAHISDTYWYLHATPILMKQIAATQESFYRGDKS